MLSHLQNRGASFTGTYNIFSLLNFSLFCTHVKLRFVKLYFELHELKQKLNFLQSLLIRSEKYIVLINQGKYKVIRSNLMEVIQLYLVMICFYLSVFMMYIYNMYLTRMKYLPLSSGYVYSNVSRPIFILLLIHQIIAMVAAFSIVVVDGMCFAIMYTAIVKLDILKENYSKISSYRQLTFWIHKHQEVIW